MKFGQFIENDMRNIFRKKSCKKYGGETIPGLISKNSKLKFMQFVFIVCKVGNY